MGRTLQQEVTDEELKKVTFLYKNLSEAGRSQMIFGANLLYASEQNRNDEKQQMKTR